MKFLIWIIFGLMLTGCSGRSAVYIVEVGASGLGVFGLTAGGCEVVTHGNEIQNLSITYDGATCDMMYDTFEKTDDK